MDSVEKPPSIGVGCGRELEWKWRGDLFTATPEDVKKQLEHLENQRFTVTDKDTGDSKVLTWKELDEGKQKEELVKQVRKISQFQYKRLQDSIYRVKKDTVRSEELLFNAHCSSGFGDSSVTLR